MAGGGGDTAPNGGEFLLSLLQKKPQHHHPLQPPAVASLPGPPWPSDLSPPPPNLLGFPHPNRLPPDDLRRLGFQQPPPPQDHNMMFGSLPFKIHNHEASFNDRNRQLDSRAASNSRGWGQQQQPAQSRRPPPGFPGTPGGVGVWDGNSIERGQGNVGRRKAVFGDLGNSSGSVSSNADDKGRTFFAEDGRVRMNYMAAQSGVGRRQLDHHSDGRILSPAVVSFDNGDQRQGGVRNESRKEGQRDCDGGSRDRELDDLGEQIVDLLLLDDESNGKSDKKKAPSAREKDFRSDPRGQRLLSQRMRNYKSMMGCRNDIYKLNAPFLAIYESLIPPEEEKAKQRQLLALLEKLVAKEWPRARLYLYGSCASTFGVCKSDVDVCLAIDDPDINKSEVILKLAEILESDNLENVQALTRARVPIVKLMDPVTGISCDICINNVLAVVNTKLLRDYAQIDVRLHQLAFIVKHWAKSRGVNETYHGTLSSYAYVVMCIHFLQQRRPPILPCLQEMETTYSVTVDDIRCAFFDKVEKLRDFGSRNRESIAQLVWGFFNYWAHCHDYSNDVISVRTGSMISKRSKDWTRRVGNDRHLICIEDPFDTSHDLGRVVDKYSIKVLREEFERAADIMQHDPNPCTSLFERYVAC